MKAISLIFFTLILSSIIQAQEERKKLIDLRPKPFVANKEGFYLLDLQIADTEAVIAYADLNNDKFTDIIVYIKREGGFDFYGEIFNSETGFFERTKSPMFKVEGDYTVLNLLVTSLEMNKTKNIILTLSGANGQETFFYGQSLDTLIFKKYDAFSIKNSPIVIANLNGKRQVDVVYDSDESPSKRKVVYFQRGKEMIIDFDSIIDTECKQPSQNRKIAKQGSAFIDVDGNCFNDLLLTTTDGTDTYLEIWQGRRQKTAIKYCFNYEIKLPKEYGAFTMGDFDNDGQIDLIFPIKQSSNVAILFNNHDFKFEWTEDYCEKHKDDNSLRKMYDLEQVKIVELEAGYTFYEDPLIPTILRVGSFNSSPFPGLITILQNKEGVKSTWIFSSTYSYPEKTDRYKIKIFKMLNEFKIADSLYASSFDFDEKGQLDIVIMTSKGMRAYFNNFQSDTFFLKSQTMLVQKEFCTNEIGANYRFIATNNDGSRRMDLAYQLIQTTNMALSVPYALAGIGRSNNYVENYFVVSSVIDPKNNIGSLTPIIPNSQLIITKKLEKEDITWEIDLIVQPMSKIIMLIIIIAIILILILIVIIILHFQEIKEDKKMQENEKFTAWFA